MRLRPNFIKIVSSEIKVVRNGFVQNRLICITPFRPYCSPFTTGIPSNYQKYLWIMLLEYSRIGNFLNEMTKFAASSLSIIPIHIKSSDVDKHLCASAQMHKYVCYMCVICEWIILLYSFFGIFKNIVTFGKNESITPLEKLK